MKTLVSLEAILEFAQIAVHYKVSFWLIQVNI